MSTFSDPHFETELNELFRKLEKESNKVISAQAYEFATHNENKSIIAAIVHKLLKENDSSNASLEQAAIIADQMQAFARQKLKELEEK